MPAPEPKCLREGRAQTSLPDSKEKNVPNGFSTAVSAEDEFQHGRSRRGTVTAEALALGKRVVVASTGSAALHLQVLQVLGMDLTCEHTTGMRVVPSISTDRCCPTIRPMRTSRLLSIEHAFDCLGYLTPIISEDRRQTSPTDAISSTCRSAHDGRMLGSSKAFRAFGRPSSQSPKACGPKWRQELGSFEAALQAVVVGRWDFEGNCRTSADSEQQEG